MIYEKYCKSCGDKFYCLGRFCKNPIEGENNCHCLKCCSDNDVTWATSECPKSSNIEEMVAIEL
jgi:hypothetical protein